MKSLVNSVASERDDFRAEVDRLKRELRGPYDENGQPVVKGSRTVLVCGFASLLLPNKDCPKIKRLFKKEELPMQFCNEASDHVEAVRTLRDIAR